MGKSIKGAGESYEKKKETESRGPPCIAWKVDSKKEQNSKTNGEEEE